MNKYYICSHCGNIIEMIEDTGVPVHCCGEKMTLLNPNTAEAATEKHLPAVTREGNLVKVQVGEVEHPMQEEHSIQWIVLETSKGSQRKLLNPGDKPIAEFQVGEEAPLAVYAYCNLHGLWKTEL